jgi:hypothetical protein
MHLFVSPDRRTSPVSAVRSRLFEDDPNVDQITADDLGGNYPL